MSNFQPSKEVAEAKRNELQSTLKAGAKELLEELRAERSERLQALLTFSAKFYRYSANNQLLIMLQCMMRGIDASYVASFTTWKSMNYAVKKGEKGIGIYAPAPYRVKNEESGEEKPHLFFKVKAVFADTQVEPMRPDVPPIPTFFTPLMGDCEALYNRLVEVVRTEGIELVEEATRGQGYSAKGRIGLKPGLDSTNKFLTLIHEYAHELLHAGSTLEKQVKECQAEAISYVVAHHFGIRNPYSSDYLQTWSNDEKSLLAELETVQKTAAKIISKMEGSSQDDLTPDRTAA